MSCFLCPLGLRYEGPDVPIYEARVPFPAPVCTWHPILGSLPVPPSFRGGRSQVWAEPLSRLNIRPQVQGWERPGAPGEGRIFPALRIRWNSREDFRRMAPPRTLLILPQGEATATATAPAPVLCGLCQG